jgi:predicted GTPase
MSRWRIAILVVLAGWPVVALAALGSYYLWTSGWSFPAWWLMAGSLGLAYLLGWYWHRQRQLLPPIDFQSLPQWTDRDRGAWQLVEARAKASMSLDRAALSDVNVYVKTAQDLAYELAHYYHPGSADPLGPLTLPEILAVVELAAHDLADLVSEYLPGGNLLSVADWKRAKQAVDWYQSASNAYWLASALFSPLNTATRFAASKLGLARPLQMLQQDLYLWFYTAYVQRVGTYLIDVNSGRLRVGAQRFRELIDQHRPATESIGATSVSVAPTAPRVVTITLMGQVKMGKSSVVNALLGERRAQTDVLPATNEVTRYQLQPAGIDAQVVLLDTVGYHHANPRADQVHSTAEAARHSDLLLLVLHACNPGRQADVELLSQLRKWFGERRDLKLPPVLGVMTHIDLLSPAMEWSPPYRWEQPARPKEKSIHAALAAAHEQFGPALVGLVPLCTATGKIYGINEWLLPAIALHLDEARGVALLRCLHAEAHAGQVRKVFLQFLASGKQVAHVFLDGLRKP